MKTMFSQLMILTALSGVLFTGCKKEHEQPSQQSNIAPVAYAGPDQTITLPANSVDLNGNGTDADGNIVSYEWTKVAGPPPCTITSANTAKTEVKDLAEGVYEFGLKVTDNKGLSSTDQVIVFVIDPMNDPCYGCWDY